MYHRDDILSVDPFENQYANVEDRKQSPLSDQSKTKSTDMKKRNAYLTP